MICLILKRSRKRIEMLSHEEKDHSTHRAFRGLFFLCELPSNLSKIEQIKKMLAHAKEKHHRGHRGKWIISLCPL